MLKIIILIISLNVLNCSSEEIQLEKKFQINKQIGCSSYTVVSSRLDCIKKMVKSLELVNNSDILFEEIEGQRYNEEFIEVIENICIISSTKEKLYCWDNSNQPKKKLKYKPTALGKIYNFATRFGLGLIIGMITGIGVN